MLFKIYRKLFHHFGYILFTINIRLITLVLILPLIASLFGCSSSTLLPSQKNIVVTPWNSYEEATKAFEKVIPYQTKKCELDELGFEPLVTSNIKILNYLDIMERFMPNQSITIKDLADGLQDCLADQEQCHAYEIIIRKFDSQRFGNVLLDLFNFRRKTTVTGWEFMALIVIKDELVVYKLSSGAPMTDEFRYSKNPLGPLQNPDKFIWTVTN
ncbi:MAG: hypothetical protein JRF05_08405 [Deltaproteobacteria bacterium]|jgi:hypothetical protein|nr:hypothetical protein [Deltaproteobacteria bacterium]